MLVTRIAVALSAVVGLAGASSACDPRLNTPGDWNVPIVAVTSSSVAFTVSAANFSFDQTYFGPARADSVAVGLVVSGYTGGSARIEIVDSSGVKQLEMPVATNVVEAQGASIVRGIAPFKVHLQFTGFSGVFVLGVAAQSP